MAIEETVTLKEIQLRLGVPQHVLIHLCEKSVVVPDFAETSGRGKRREFSQRNLFEFAVALTLREFELSVATTALLVRLLRSFERALAKLVPEFTLLEFLATKGAHFVFAVYDGNLLVISARGGMLRKPVILKAKLSTDTTPRLEKLDALPRDFEGRLEIDLVQISRRIAH